MRRNFLGLGFALCLLSACRALGHEFPQDSTQAISPGKSLEIERDMKRGVPPEFEPVLEAIQVALDDGDEPNARRALLRLMARNPKGRTLELARGFERILDGRERVGWLDFRLEQRPIASAPNAFLLELVVAQHGPEELTLNAGGAYLQATQFAVDPDGRERRGSRRNAVPFPKKLTIATDREVRLPIAELSLEPPADVLAFSSAFTLEILPGEFVEGGRYLPAQEIPIEALELVRLAGELPVAAIDPALLVEYVQKGRIFVPALMERAVRIAPERREEALDLLSPVVEHMNVVELELLVPALRWLSRRTTPGGDPEAWRRWLRGRNRAGIQQLEPDWNRLQLPR